MVKKFVITGGPGFGKTSVVQELKCRGFHTLSECARKVIVAESEKGSNHLPWGDVEAFQRKVFDMQLESEGKIPKEWDFVFLDRGCIDGLAYFELNGLEIPKDLVEKAKKVKYDLVFSLGMLPDYTTDKERREDKETAKKVHELINWFYEKYGYRVIGVPRNTKETRADFIIDFVNRTIIK
jgi:predicted ATPase